MRKLYLFLLFASTLLTDYALGAEITVVVNRILISGEIVVGDYQKIVHAVNDHGSIPRALALNSGGGNVVEAIKIGDFAREALLTAYVDEKDICYSACLLVYLGALRSFVTTDAGIQKSTSDVIFDPYSGEVKNLGIHRPYFDPKQFAELSGNQARLEYRKMEEMVQSYLSRMDVAQAFNRTMMSIPSKEILKVSQHQLNKLTGRKWSSVPAYHEEWIAAKCGSFSFTESEKNDYNHNYKTISPDYIAHLNDMLDKKRDCKFNAEDAVRQRVLDEL